MSEQPDHEIIAVPNRLKAKVTRDDGLTLEQAEAQVESDLAAVREECESWIKGELARLAALVAPLVAPAEAQGALTRDEAERAFRGIHDIKGLAGTFELTLLAQIAACYCRFAESDQVIARQRIDLLAAHVNAMRAAHLAPCADDAAAEVLQALEAAVAKALSDSAASGTAAAD